MQFDTAPLCFHSASAQMDHWQVYTINTTVVGTVNTNDQYTP